MYARDILPPTQLATHTHLQKPFHLNILALLQYLTYNTITVPPNFWWQRYLEIRYPGSPRRSPQNGAAPDPTQGSILPVMEIKEKPQPPAAVPASRWLGMSPGTRNFIAKFLLDQSVGSVVNILLFIVLINVLQGGGLRVVWEAVCQVCLLCSSWWWCAG